MARNKKGPELTLVKPTLRQVRVRTIANNYLQKTNNRLSCANLGVGWQQFDWLSHHQRHEEKVDLGDVYVLCEQVG